VEKVIGRTFKDDTIFLDFSYYEKCSFINCTLVIEYGFFHLIDNDFSNCRLSMRGPAETIARFLQAWFKDKPIWFEKQ
jgi:hypothetical protein